MRLAHPEALSVRYAQATLAAGAEIHVAFAKDTTKLSEPDLPEG